MDFQSKDFPIAVEDDESIGGAGVADDVAARGLGADDVAEFAAFAVEGKEAVAGGVIGAERCGSGQEGNNFGGSYR